MIGDVGSSVSDVERDVVMVWYTGDEQQREATTDLRLSLLLKS